MENEITITGTATIIYKVDKQLVEDMENILEKYNCIVEKDNGEENFNEILKEFSSVKYFNIISSKNKDLKAKFLFDKSMGKYKDYPVLNNVHIAKLFKEDENYTQFYIAFVFNIENEADITKEILNNYVNKFFQANELFKNFRRDDKPFSILFEKRFISGLYIRSIKNNNEIQENFIKTILRLTNYDKIENFVGIINDDHIQYINYRNNISLEYVINENGKRSFKRVNQYILAIAYKNYYREKSLEISRKALELDASKYEEILTFAEKIAKFEAIYYTENPTNQEYYEEFFDKFKIKKIHDEFIESLNGLVKYLGIIHNKREAERLEKERIDREEQRHREEQRLQQERLEREEERRLEAQRFEQEKLEREEERHREEQRRLEELKRREEEKELERLKRLKIAEIKEKMNEEIFKIKENINEIDNQRKRTWAIIIGIITTLFTITGGVVGGVDAITKYTLITIGAGIVIALFIGFGFRNNRIAENEIKNNKELIEKAEIEQNKKIEEINNLSNIDELKKV